MVHVCYNKINTFAMLVFWHYLVFFYMCMLSIFIQPNFKLNYVSYNKSCELEALGRVSFRWYASNFIPTSGTRVSISYLMISYTKWIHSILGRPFESVVGEIQQFYVKKCENLEIQAPYYFCWLRLLFLSVNMAQYLVSW